MSTPKMHYAPESEHIRKQRGGPHEKSLRANVPWGPLGKLALAILVSTAPALLRLA